MLKDEIILNPANALFLQKRINRWFQKKFKTTPTIFSTLADVTWDCQDSSDVVLLGDALFILKQARYWAPKKSYRIWLLSHQYKELLGKELDIDPAFFGVIPRYELVSRARDVKPINWKKPVDLIFAGRPLPSKNLEAVILLTEALQKLKLPCSLHITGPFKGETFFSLARYMELIESIHWTYSPPVVHGNLGKNWTKHPWKNPIYISLSQTNSEDFSVSLAEAEEARFPLLLSEWLVHKEIIHPELHLLPIKRRNHFDNMAGELIGRKHHVAGEFIDLNQAVLPYNVSRGFLRKLAAKMTLAGDDFSILDRRGSDEREEREKRKEGKKRR